MKNHAQMCGLAVALDYIGDRWTLLIVRELLVSARSFSEIQGSLSGCSPNLLVSRLREMIQSGLVCQIKKGSNEREHYQLTELGVSLRETVESLVKWGGHQIPKQKGLKERRPHWLEVAVPALVRPKLKLGSRFKLQFLIGDYEFAVAANDFEIDVIKGMSESPEITLNLPYEKLLAVMSGYLPPKSLSQDEIISKRYPTKSAAVQRLHEILA